MNDDEDSLHIASVSASVSDREASRSLEVEPRNLLPTIASLAANVRDDQSVSPTGAAFGVDLIDPEDFPVARELEPFGPTPGFFVFASNS